MNNRGYSQGNSKGLNAERSGLSASGTYRAPYKLEPLLTGIIFGVCGALVLLVFIFVVRFTRENIKLDSSALMTLLATTLSVAILEALVILSAVLLVRFIRSGYKCSYSADGERFITNERGKIRTVFFRDVQSVNFFSITVFGKERGYDVDVKLLNKYDETYSIVSDGFLSEKSTPFYIIIERVEQIRREQAHKRYEQEMSNLGVSGTNEPIQRKSLENIGSPVTNRLGQDVVMPGLKLSAMVAAVSEQKPSGNTNIGDYYIDELGRERLYNEMIGSGHFKVVCSRRKMKVLAVIAAASVVIAVYFSYAFIDGLKMQTLSASELLYMPFVVLIAILAAVLVAIIFLMGDECTYRANGREFVVIDKKGGETHIAYEHAQSVHYFNMLLGYKVKILTAYGIITFNCLDKRPSIYEKPEKLPFDIITKNIKK